MTFEEYLATKKIDSATFASANPTVWREWQHDFAHQHPNSFTAQKLYLINKIRREFPLKTEAPISTSFAPAEPAQPLKPKPIMRPKIT